MLGFLLSAVAAVSQKLDPSHLVPANKGLSRSWNQSLYDNHKKVFKGSQLLTIGMPCGGIAAGQLYVRGDGTLANWWIYNNAYNTGYGIDSLTHFNTALGPWDVCYHTFEPKSYIDQGFNIKIEQDGQTISADLNKQDFDDISFTGEYPIATIDYHSTSKKLPVAIQSEVYSPFIPMNARASATPGTILKFTVKNTSAKPVKVSLSGWLENFVCLDIKADIAANRRNRICQKTGLTSLVMDLTPANREAYDKQQKITLFDDFEASDNKWKIQGAAFGHIAAKKATASDKVNHFISSAQKGDSLEGKMTSESFTIPGRFIVFKIGGGRHSSTAAFNLVVDGRVVRTVTGDNSDRLADHFWDVTDLKGKQAHFEILDREKGNWGHIMVDSIGFSNMPVSADRYFPEGHPYYGNASLSVLADSGFGNADIKAAAGNENGRSASTAAYNKLVGNVGTAIDLQPGQSRDITFLLTWYFPNRPSYYKGSDVTDILPNDWNQALPVDSATIIGNMYSNWFNSAQDVALYLQKNLSWLSRETHLFRDAYYNNSTVPYWLNARLLMPLSILATETCQWWADGKFWGWEGVGSCVGTCTHVWNYEQALAHFFPELERNIREQTDFGTSFQKDGSILARNGWGGVLIDGHAGAILKAYRENLNAKDGLFLSRNWDRIKRATLYLIKEDGNDDGLIEKVQANTFDIAFYGANTYVGSLYLAALKAAAGMAFLMNDTAFANRCLHIAKAGAENSVKKLWNGHYFIQDVDLAKHPKFQYKDGCLSDQLFGQTWNHLNNLGYIYPKQQVRQTLESIWKYNWAPDVAVQNKVHPPERTYADYGEPGLLVCSWPFSPHMGEDGVRYRDEVWTGMEYEVATNMIYEDMVDQGLSIVKAVDSRYSPEKHNPWNEIECGDHYARAMASWGVMLALEDYFYDGPKGVLGFNPKISPEKFEGFFTSAEGWGNIKQERSGGVQQNSVVLKYGKLALQKIQLTSPRQPQKIQVLLNNKAVDSHFSVDGDKVAVAFEKVNLTPEDIIDIKTTY